MTAPKKKGKGGSQKNPAKKEAKKREKERKKNQLQASDCQQAGPLIG